MNRREHLALAGRWLAASPITTLVLAGCAQRDTAPNITYTLLNGQQKTLMEQRGKVMLVNFWATSCTTCVHEMPQLIATHQQFAGKGFDTLAVAMSYDPPAYVTTFAQSRQLPFGVAVDNTGDIAKRFGDIRLTPTSFLLDKRGGIVKKYVGEPDFAALHQLIGELIAET